IAHAHPRFEGKGPVGGGHFFHVVDLTVGCRTAMIRMAIPARQSALFVPYPGCCGERRRGDPAVFFMCAAAYYHKARGQGTSIFHSIWMIISRFMPGNNRVVAAPDFRANKSSPART